MRESLNPNKKIITTELISYPTFDEQAGFIQRGYQLDNFGRPVHPWLVEVLTDPDATVSYGRGEFWHWGPNYTVDPLVISAGENPSILLIKRGDTGNWALPGGFVDDGELEVEAARRELCEETGIVIAGEPIEIYRGIVADHRTTLNAWPETTALLWCVDYQLEAAAQDDATDTKWFSLKQLPVNLHGSHADIIEKAFGAYDLSIKNGER